ncbi:S8 family peptidase [Oharaeibacter diazotrophicus]|uniref:Subtilase family protein n=1 Tax=Oharaeibacter diazotrophicus TaxID=1920512 RepID=A0A4R6R9Y2_9HYPH|nr:S8/S53 family peptidase [Oharaeibacter diazotrophicus]TDP82685.1 subtilase family protein [Oharaeibacter diazotrophicus]BBE72553.1 subtilase family protein [Pleomorphomonas sp. SM30]GLS76583.1 hypothetical protein GCM10007904_19200 [Oharaeibacter diazotrophicus]
MRAFVLSAWLVVAAILCAAPAALAADVAFATAVADGRMSAADAARFEDADVSYHRVMVRTAAGRAVLGGVDHDARRVALARRVGVVEALFGSVERAAADAGLLMFDRQETFSATLSTEEIRRLLAHPDVRRVHRVPTAPLEAVLRGAAAGADAGAVQKLAFATLGIDEMKKAKLNGAGRSVAIIDSGIDMTLRQMKTAVIDGFCFSRNDARLGLKGTCPIGIRYGARGLKAGAQTCRALGCDHGTAVASVIVGAKTSSGGMVVQGVAPAAKIVAVNAARFDTRTNMMIVAYDDILRAYETLFPEVVAPTGRIANYPIAAVNVSASVPCDLDVYQDGDDQAYAMQSYGVATVAAAGNEGLWSKTEQGWPACNSSVHGVGELDTAYKPTDITNWSGYYAVSQGYPVVDSDMAKGGFAVAEGSGTSFSAPLVTGAHLLGRQVNGRGLLGAPNVDLYFDPDHDSNYRLYHGRIPRVDGKVAWDGRFVTFVPSKIKTYQLDAPDEDGKQEGDVYCRDYEYYSFNTAFDEWHKSTTLDCQSTNDFTAYMYPFLPTNYKVRLLGQNFLAPVDLKDEYIHGYNVSATSGAEMDDDKFRAWTKPLFETEVVITNARGQVVERMPVMVTKSKRICTGPDKSKTNPSKTCGKCVYGCKYR